MATKRTKPKTPEQIAADKASARALAFAEVGMQAAASTLKANADIQAEAKTREHTARARRMDAFEHLKEGMGKGHYDAARRLERDITISRGEHDRGRSLDRVDNDKATDRTDAMIAASKRVEHALARIGERDGWLLTQLIAPAIHVALSATTWRDVVSYITGEENPHAQAAVVRAACANLAAVYDRELVAA
jgi:hypothetical protein